MLSTLSERAVAPAGVESVGDDKTDHQAREQAKDAEQDVVLTHCCLIVAEDRCKEECSKMLFKRRRAPPSVSAESGARF